MLVILDNIEDILLSANHIQMLPVVQACSNFLRDNLTLENCSNMVGWAEMFAMVDLKSHIYKFMCSNLSNLILLPNFQTLPYEQLRTVLSCNYPVDCAEVDILTAVLSWVSVSADRRQHIASLSSYLHIQNIDGHILKNACKNPLFIDLLNNDMSFVKLISNPNILAQTSSVVNSSNPNILAQTSSVINSSGLVNTRGYTKSLVCVGGFGTSRGMSNDLQYFTQDSKSRSWTYLSTIPHVKQCNFGQAVLKNNLYVIGGCYNDNMQEVVHSYGFKYDTRTNSWNNIAEMSIERCRFYLGVVGNHLFGIGGDPSASDPGLSNEARCEKYNPDTDTWSPIASLPVNRSQHTGIGQGHFLYVSGGLQDLDDGVFSDFHKYDTIEDTWQELSPMLTPRADHTMFVYKGSIYVIGGWWEDANQQRIMAANIDCYDAESDSWVTVGTVPHPRLYATYTLVGSEVYIIGGWLNGDYQRKAHTVQVCNMDTNTWREEEGVNIEVWEHNCSTLYVPCNDQL